MKELKARHATDFNELRFKAFTMECFHFPRLNGKIIFY